jgi:hypothetical protein
MMRLRQFCAATILTIAVSLSAFAGNINCGDVPPPPDPPASAMGQMATGVTATNEESAETSYVDPVTEFALNFLQDLLSLF